MKKILLLLLIPVYAFGQTNKTIGDLTAVSTVNDADVYVVEQSDSTRKIAYSTLKDSLLNDLQTDVTALESEVDTDSTTAADHIANTSTFHGFDYGSAARIPYMNGTSDGFSYSSGLQYDGAKINLSSAGGITFGTGTDYMIYRSSSALYCQVNGFTTGMFGASYFRFFLPVLPQGNAAQDIGADSLYFDNGYFDDLIVNTPMSDAEVADDITASNYLLLTDTATMLDPYLTEVAAASTYEVQLDNEAGLYAVLSDVTQFIEPGDSPTLLDGTAHRLFYTDGSGNVTELAFGTDGQVLTSTGASTAPAFEDAAAGGSSDSSWVSITIDGVEIDSTDAANINSLSNSVTVPYTIPWAFVDSAGMAASRDYAPFVWTGTPDTIGIDSVCVMSITSGTPNFTFQMYVNDTLNTTATSAVTVFSSAQTVGAASATVGQWFTPNNRAYILPDEKIWIRFIGRTTVPEHGATIQINGTVY